MELYVLSYGLIYSNNQLLHSGELMNNKIKALLLYVLLCICIFFSASSIHAGELKPHNSNVNYVIYVNRALNCVTVYRVKPDGEEVPVRSMVCSCGRTGHNTPLGTFKTSQYYDWRNMVDGSWGRYAVRFNGKVMFHSVPYHSKSPSDLEWDQYNLLGQSASLGCVRLSLADAKWIYTNCKIGTKVVMYSDEESPGRLGKPEAVKIDEKSPYKGWDPTDTDPDNPWRNNK